MARASAFSDCHPLVNLLFFALMLAVTMFVLHPVCLAVSLGGALACLVSLRGWRGAAESGKLVVPVALLAALLNPAFNHRGATILLYLPTGNPLTLESILYGLAAGAMLAAVVLWFACINAVMTSDKFVYLFGRWAPALSLVLSMALGFLPRFARQLRAVGQARRAAGRDLARGSLPGRLREAAAQFSILITWSLENAVDTADSMRSRGYGLPGRTAFSLYRLSGRDRALLLWMGLLGLWVGSVWLSGGFDSQYFPRFQAGFFSPGTAAGCLALLLLALTPVILNTWEARTWTRLHSGN